MRSKMLLLLSILAAAAPCGAAPSIRAITEVIDGHSVGGVSLDLIGNLYVADFGEDVWKITPEGERRELASGFYGASGNAVDKAGNLLQSNFYADSIFRVDRAGHASPFVTKGLFGPVGIAVAEGSGEIFVANCRGNDIIRIGPGGETLQFARSELFKCPNGIAVDRNGNLYVANFRDNKVLKVGANGTVSLFATVSAKGLGHLCFKTDRFYVTAHESHEVYELSLAGVAKRILGNGERGIVDGSGERARLSFPNGIACDPFRPRLIINEYVNESTAALPRRTIVREIALDGTH